MVTVFVSYDVHHDQELADRLTKQSRRSDSPFKVIGSTATVASMTDTRSALRRRTIARAGHVAVICTMGDRVAASVEEELQLAHELDTPHFLLGSGPDGTARKPARAFVGDRLYIWTWENLLTLLCTHGA